MRLSSLPDHLVRFGVAVSSIDGYCSRFQDATGLLQYAGGIQGINYSAASEDGIYCHGVARYEREQERALAPFLTSQAVFSVVWIALENFVKELNLPTKSLGRVGSLCQFLKDDAAAISELQGYSKHLADWKALERELTPAYKPRTDLPANVDANGEALYRVCSFRNHLFHGDFPASDPTSGSWDAYKSALDLGTRLVAFTLQMGLMAAFQTAEFMRPRWHSEVFDEREEVSIREGLSLLHLDPD